MMVLKAFHSDEAYGNSSGAIREIEKLQKFLFQILSGIDYCHSHGVLYRDLKPQNLLIKKDTLSSKIADFGLARTVVHPTMEFTEEVGTFYYKAPELLLGSKLYSAPFDMWSIGCIFSEMLSRNHWQLFPWMPNVLLLDQICSLCGP